MSGQIRIRYTEVASQTAKFRANTISEIANAENSYRQIQTSLNRLDGAANAGLIRTAQLGSRKARAAGMTLDKMAHFIDISARQVDIAERSIISKLSQISISS